MFISSEKFVEAHGGRVGDISIYGQESNHTTWRLAKLNLAIRGIDANIVHGDTFHADGHKDLKADYVLANPPFNDSDWGQPRLKEDVRWKYGVPPAGNANFLAQAVAGNPGCIGIGLGEDTGVLVTNGNNMEAIGSGLILIFDGHNIKHSNIADVEEGTPLSIENMIVHVMAKGNHFHIKQRKFYSDHAAVNA
jgi:hypothetical protein